MYDFTWLLMIQSFAVELYLNLLHLLLKIYQVFLLKDFSINLLAHTFVYTFTKGC